MIATTFGVGQVVYSILWFVLFFVEIWLSISIFIDIFRSHDLAGWAKALWVLLVLLLPIIGIIAYFIFRGDKMRVHQMQAQQSGESFTDYARQPRDDGESPAQELSRLADLRRDGMITEDEFEVLKSHVMRRVSDKDVP
ncbi:MAG: SHOCT domain-containing protein [Acidimicrobiales bacterium]